MTRPKRGEQIPPPPSGNEWDLRYATKESLAYGEMAKQYPGNTNEVTARLKGAPTTRSDVQKRLRGSLGKRVLGGVEMEQWQYDISSGARLWYCVDPDRHIVWLTLVAMGHPRATEAKGKRAPRNR